MATNQHCTGHLTWVRLGLSFSCCSSALTPLWIFVWMVQPHTPCWRPSRPAQQGKTVSFGDGWTHQCHLSTPLPSHFWVYIRSHYQKRKSCLFYEQCLPIQLYTPVTQSVNKSSMILSLPLPSFEPLRHKRMIWRLKKCQDALFCSCCEFAFANQTGL